MTRQVRHFIGGELVDSRRRDHVRVGVADRQLGDRARWPAARRRTRTAPSRRPGGPSTRARGRGCSPAARASCCIHAVAALIDERREEFAAAETLDMGKPISESRTKDIPRAAYNLRFFADFAEHTHTETYAKPWDGVLTYTLREPAGVAACISPWNFPLMLATWKIAPGAGLRQHRRAQARRAEPADRGAARPGRSPTPGLPPGVFNVVQGFGPGEAGERLTEHPGVDLITFTGESATGRADHGQGRGHAQALLVRAGRQERRRS